MSDPLSEHEHISYEVHLMEQLAYQERLKKLIEEYPNGAAHRMFDAVVKERKRQLEKWGEQHKDLGTWTLVLTEELGEFSQAVLDRKPKEAFDELVQVVAVGLAMLEDRAFFVDDKGPLLRLGIF